MMAYFKLKQKNHIGKDPYYAGTGKYFGLDFTQTGEELVASGTEKDFQSLVDAGKVKKLTDYGYKELLEEAGLPAPATTDKK